MKNKKTFFIPPIIIIIAVLILISIIIFVIPFPYKATEAHNIQESYVVQVPYTERVDEVDCDFKPGCKCDGAIQTGLKWLGLAKCQSCKCSGTRTETRYRTVQKQTKVWKTDTLFNMATGKTKYWFEV